MAKTDTNLALYAVIIITTYLVIFLGNFSPIHCRLSIALIGIICIGISVTSSFGLGIQFGYVQTRAQEALPILMLGIGVDDIFIICNSLDQTSLNSSPQKRIMEALKHAGPSITITSFTDCFAFLSGITSQIEGIRSFCVYCALSVAMLYCCIMTVFMVFLFYDTWRVSKKYRECCSLCFCKEDSVIFCGGNFLTQPQKRYSKIDTPVKVVDPTLENNSHVVASYTERFLLEKVAPLYFKRTVKILILSSFTVLTAISIYAAS